METCRLNRPRRNAECPCDHGSGRGSRAQDEPGRESRCFSVRVGPRLAAKALGERVDPLGEAPRGPIELRPAAGDVEEGERRVRDEGRKRPAIEVEEVQVEVGRPKVGRLHRTGADAGYPIVRARGRGFRGLEGQARRLASVGARVDLGRLAEQRAGDDQADEEDGGDSVHENLTLETSYVVSANGPMEWIGCQARAQLRDSIRIIGRVSACVHSDQVQRQSAPEP